jgi:hypothetical protein
MKLQAGGVVVAMVLAGLGVAASGCEGTQASLDRNQQRLLRPSSTGGGPDAPPSMPATTPHSSQAMDPMKFKNKPGVP